MVIRWKMKALGGLMLAAAGCATESNDDDIVARVGAYDFTVDQAVELLVDEERLASDVGIVNSLAELWVDYTLLAEAASRDTMFSDLDLEPLITQQLSQVMVFQLRDSVMQIDTFITEGELQDRYESDAPAVEIRARHLMLRIPVQATQEQKDSVVTRLEEIRAQILAGARFEALASQFSQDPGSARSGGDLGFFGRGDMVAPFEEAALTLEEGELSEVVETPMGLHLIRVDERQIRDFEEVTTEYRQQVQGRMLAEAESLFVAGIVEQADPVIADGALDVTREMAETPGARLSGRAARRTLVGWDNGSVTVGELQELLQLESAAVRDQIAAGSDEDTELFLEGVSRRDLLVREAQAADLQIPRDSVQGLVDDAVSQLRSATRMLGLLNLDQAPGERIEVAVTRAVLKALTGNLTGATQVVPLGLISFQLRSGTSSTVLQDGVGQVIFRVAQARASRSLSPLEQALDSAQIAADTVGN
jgi:parvulin-like peptidyl-prolyl isomerase